VPADGLHEGRDEAEPAADRLEEPEEGEPAAEGQDEPLEDDVQDVLVQPREEVRRGDRPDVPRREPPGPPEGVAHDPRTPGAS